MKRRLKTRLKTRLTNEIETEIEANDSIRTLLVREGRMTDQRLAVAHAPRREKS